MIIGLLLEAFIVASRLAFHFYGNAVMANEQVKQQRKTLAQQSGLLSILQTQDRKNRALATEQHPREQLLSQHEETYQRKYSESIKNTPVLLNLYLPLLLSSCSKTTQTT